MNNNYTKRTDYHLYPSSNQMVDSLQHSKLIKLTDSQQHSKLNKVTDSLHYSNSKNIADTCPSSNANDTTSKTDDIIKYKQNIVDTINRLMYAKGWSIRQLSELSDLPYESVKKLVGGKINNPSIYTLIKISSALDCSIDFLTDPKKLITHNYESLSERALTLLYELADFESHVADYNRRYNADKLTTFVPTGNIYDGMVFDSFYTDTVNVGSYYEEFGDIIMCAVKIIGTNLHPTYLNNDILLIGKDRYPRGDEVGIFLKGQRVYIRKYISDFPIELAPVNNIGTSLIVSDINDVHFFGRVLTVIRK